MRERILREAGFEEQVKEARTGLLVPTGEDLVEEITDWLPENEARPWWDYVDEAAREIAQGEGQS